MNSIGILLATALAVLLFISGIGKALRLARFRRVLAGTYGMPENVVRSLAVFVPAYEICASLLLLTDGGRLVGLAASAGFFAAAFFVAAIAMLGGRTGDCGCFGELIEQPLGPGVLVRLSALLIVTGLAIVLLLPVAGGRLLAPGIADVLLAACGIAVAALSLMAAGRASRAMKGE